MAASPLFAFFGTPLAALAVAVGAVSIPLFVHLLNRRRYRIVSWAAMRFLLAAERHNTRQVRLEQILLLTVRSLIMLCLVLAMASVMPWAETVWHFLFPANLVPPAVASHRTHKVLVVDGSFSMAVKAGEQSCFDRARTMAAQIVREAPRGDGFSVVLMAEPARRIISEAAEDPRKVAAEIQNLRLPHGNADPGSAFHAVQDLLRQSPSKFAEREVYFLTDLQRSTWVARQPAALAMAMQKIQSRARTILIDVGQDDIPNLAVTQLALAAPLRMVGAEIPISATIHNYGSEARNGLRTELWVGKARSASSDAPYQLHMAQQSMVRIGRGQNTISFPYKFTSPGDYLIQVRIENDAQELDDVRSAVVTVKDGVPVMIVDGKSSAREELERGAEWLRIALNPFKTNTVSSIATPQPKVLDESQFADAGLGDLTPYDCVFFCDVAQFSPAEVRRMETHLRRGGGVVFCLGKQVDLGAYNQFLYRNGDGLLPAKLMGQQAAPAGVYFHFAVEGKAYQEPPLDAFSDDGVRAGLLAARFHHYMRTELTPSGGARKVLSFVPALSMVRSTPELAKEFDRLPASDPAIVEWQPPLPNRTETSTTDTPRSRERLRGRVVLVTTTVNMDWNSWPISPSYPAMMQELLHFAASGRLREQILTVGDPIEEFLPTAGGGLDVLLHTPDGRSENCRTQAHEDASLMRWTDTDRSGVYRATIGQNPREYLFAVNVPAASANDQTSESDPSRTQREELQKTYPEWDFQLVNDLATVVHSSNSSGASDGTLSPLGPSIARGLFLLILLLLGLEVILAWRFGHHSSMSATTESATGAVVWLLMAVAGGVGIILTILAGVLVHSVWTGDFLGFLPDSLRSRLESLLDIPPPVAGEGSLWRLEFSPFLWDASTDPWLAGLLAVGGVALVVWVYRREGQTANLPYRLFLACLRIIVLLVTVSVLLPQMSLWFERQGWPDVVIILDDSQSMSVVDHYQSSQVKEIAEQLATETSLPQADRFRLAQALLTRAQTDWLKTLLIQRKVRIHVYHCSTRASRLYDVNEREQIPGALQALRDLQIQPKNDSSQLGAAVRQVLNDFRGSSLAAVIMLSDGITTEGEDLVKASRYAATMGVSLFFVGMGDAREARDLALHDLQVEDSVYVQDRLIFEVRLTGRGYGDATVPVYLREKGKDRILAVQRVKLDPQGKPVKVRLVHQPSEPGQRVYVLDVPVREDEAQSENNRLERGIFVREAKLIKVLYVEGEPRWEFRYLKTLLERESNRTRGNKSIDLKVVLLRSDLDWASQDKSALVEFPSKADLQQYDVIILGDVDPKFNPQMREHLQNLADFVRERGGGLLMLAGEHYAPHAYKDTPLHNILPVNILSDQQPDEPPQGRMQGYRLNLTPVGRLHPIFRFSPDEKESDEICNKLHEMFWWAEGYEAKRSAEVLAVHPQRRRSVASSPSSATDEPLRNEGHPLVIQQFIGAGRCLFFGFHETWRWRWREDELRFNQFWIQTVRYLARNRAGRVELRLDRQTPYRRGEPIRITVRFPDDAPPPALETDVQVVLERRPPRGIRVSEREVQTIRLAKIEGSRSTYEALLTQTPEGEYLFWLSSPTITGARPRVEGRVLAPPGEMEQLRMNQADMEQAATATHGQFYTLATADHFLHDMPSGTRLTLNAAAPPWLLWNQTFVFGMVIFLLSSEWILRKRKHLL